MTLELQRNWGRLIHELFFQFVEGLIHKLKLPDLASFTAEEKETWSNCSILHAKKSSKNHGKQESYRVYRIDISDALIIIYLFTVLLNDPFFSGIRQKISGKRLFEISDALIHGLL